jgi:hypothetical protein
MLCVEMAADRVVMVIRLRSNAIGFGMRDHTSLLAWREAQSVSLAILAISQTYWKPYAQAVFNQVQRSSISVQTNISEGYSFTNTPSFHRHLRIAYGSAVETGDLLSLM